jgi:hypothetical protein
VNTGIAEFLAIISIGRRLDVVADERYCFTVLERCEEDVLLLR